MTYFEVEKIVQYLEKQKKEEEKEKLKELDEYMMNYQKQYNKINHNEGI